MIGGSRESMTERQAEAPATVAGAGRAANASAFARLVGGHPFLVDVRPAIDVVPGMHPDLVLHAGPPLAWDEMVPPMQAAVAGALVYGGRCRTLDDAEALARDGRIRFAPAHDHGMVGPMAGVVSATMPVFVVRNEAYANLAFATINEGLGRVLRFGANDESVLTRLAWIRDVLAPSLGAALRRSGPIDLRQMIGEALHRGDEAHNRNKAGTALFVRHIAPHLCRAVAGDVAAECLEFIGGNDHFFLNLSIAHSKAVTDAVGTVAGSTLVTAMAGNGVRFGLRVAGLGSAWITAPPDPPVGRMFEGFSQSDGVPLMGDSYVSEVAGVGAFALAAAPAIAGFIGGRAGEMVAHTQRMYGITAGEHPVFTIPALDFRGTPVGIDVDRVVATGVQPILNTGIAGRRPGVGQVGAGIASAPLACFVDAAARLAR
ncbi:MAG: YlbE family protein [bacterium]